VLFYFVKQAHISAVGSSQIGICVADSDSSADQPIIRVRCVVIGRESNEKVRAALVRAKRQPSGAHLLWQNVPGISNAEKILWLVSSAGWVG
jgi:hypothetical protein